MVAAGLGLRGLDTRGLEAGRVNWLRLDAAFAQHPKVIGLTDRAFRLHVAALCYCGRHDTDGRMSRESVRSIADTQNIRKRLTYITELVQAGLWDLPTDEKQGFAIHGWGDWNLTKADVERDREAARERMRRLRSGERSEARSHERSGEVRQQTRSRSIEERPRPIGQSPARTNGQGNLTTTVATTAQLEALVRNGGYAYTDTSLADELRAKGADDTQISEMLELAGTLRTAAT